MRVFNPEISWHNRLPTLALDVAPKRESSGCYRVATGGNDCRVYIWIINPKSLDIRIRAGLRRHQKSVGAVRFSPQQMLASGDDDGYIYLWKRKSEEISDQPIQFQQQPQQQPSADSFLNDDGFEDLETWQHHKVLRGHIEDVCDLAWSSDGKYLLSGSVDNSAILWDTERGVKIWCSDLIKGYVQGVAIDPHGEFMAALSTDRTLRIYNFEDRRMLLATRRMNIKNKFKAFFCDDTVQTFCRRFEFSPDGQFLIAPTSRLAEQEKQQHKVDSSEPLAAAAAAAVAATGQSDEIQQIKKLKVTSEQQGAAGTTTPPSKPINVFLVLRRTSLNKPIYYYPTGKEVALCARFSPVAYKLRPGEQQNLWNIPYRIVFAIATTRSVLIYDSQQATPIAYVSQIHLARITDISWSGDGRMLMVSSYDGYTSMVLFDKEEIGELFTGELLKPVEEEVPPPAPPPPPPAKVKPPTPPPKKVPESMTIRKYLIKRA